MAKIPKVSGNTMIKYLIRNPKEHMIDDRPQ